MRSDAAAHARDSAGASPRGRESAPPRILVVDNQPFVLNFTTDALTRSGYRVDSAPDGATAWLMINTHPYDLLITDHLMPRMSGVELMELVRFSHMTLPVIMVTGEFPKEDFTRYPWLKAAATLLKPYTTTDLLRAVTHVLHPTESPLES
jgi:DNA-binding response OmpR family regulator